MRTKEAIRKQRTEKVDGLRALTDKAATENRALTTEETATFAAGETEIRSLDEELRRAEFMAECERRSHADPVTPARGDSLAALETRFQVGKALQEFSARQELTGVEGEWAAEHRSGRPGAIAMPTSAFLGERRVGQTVGSGPEGGYLVPTQLGPMIDRHRPRLATETLGATVMSGLTGPLDLPRLNQSGTAQWISETGNPARSAASFGQISMSPGTVSAEYALTRRAMIQAPQLEGVLRRDIGLLLAQALDAAAINGNGIGKPLGVLGWADVHVVAMGPNGDAPTIDTAADLIGAVEVADAFGATGFLTNAKVKKTVLKLKDGDGRPWALEQVFKGETVSISSQVPSNLTKGSGSNLSAILFGIWADLVIGYWSSVDILLNPYHSDVASSGGALLHAFLDADTALRHGESFAVAKDVVTS